MKRVFTFATLILIMAYTNLFSIENEIVLGPNYENDVWFSLTDGIVKEEPTNNWDIGFQTYLSQNAGIIINSAKGVMLYVVEGSDGDSWDNPVDTNGMSSSWVKGYNSIETWNVGAFNLGKEGFETGGDYGWGSYNMATHAIAGNKVFIIKLNNTTFKKIMIESLLSGVYTFLVANLDGSNEASVKVKKSDYLNNLYAYVDLSDNSIIGREPAFVSWDLVFSKYTDLIDMGDGSFAAYTVTGVRTHPLQRTAVVTGVPTNQAYAPIINDMNYSTVITSIGSSWKKYNSSTSSYSIVDSVSYFVTLDMNNEINPNISKIVFKSFEGSSTGKIVFDLSGNETTVNEDLLKSLNVFPSIVDKSSNVNIDLGDYKNQSLKTIKLFNTAGNLVKNISSLQDFSAGKFDISLEELSSGMYYMVFEFENTNLMKKIIVK